MSLIESAGSGVPRLFSVKVPKNAQMLYGLALSLARTDLFIDRRPGMSILSNTGFINHPIFNNENTALHTINPTERIPKVSTLELLAPLGERSAQDHGLYRLSTTLVQTIDYLDANNSGFVPGDKVQQIATQMREQLPSREVRGFTTAHINTISIPGDRCRISISFGFPTLEAKISQRTKVQEMVRELIHPEGRYNLGYRSYLDHLIRKSQAEDDPAWQESLKGRLDLSAVPNRILSDRNEFIKIDLLGIYDYKNPHGFLYSALGVPLTDAEQMVDILNFYAQSYTAFVRAICTVERVLQPEPNVFLGSELLK